MAGLQQRSGGVANHLEVDLAQFAFFHGSTPYKLRFILARSAHGKAAPLFSTDQGGKRIIRDFKRPAAAGVRPAASPGRWPPNSGFRNLGILECANPYEDKMRPRFGFAEEMRAARGAKLAMPCFRYRPSMDSRVICQLLWVPRKEMPH
jgi:hypothetical protein